MTVCVWERWECLGKTEDGKMVLNRYGMIVRDAWYDLVNHYDCQLDEFIVMPNHIHGIVIIGNKFMHVGEGLKPSPTYGKKSHGLPEIIRGFKTFSSRRINLVDLNCKFRWQRSYYDRVIRNDTELNRIREYIQNNPLQWDTDEENPASAGRGVV